MRDSRCERLPAGSEDERWAVGGKRASFCWDGEVDTGAEITDGDGGSGKWSQAGQAGGNGRTEDEEAGERH